MTMNLIVSISLGVAGVCCLVEGLTHACRWWFDRRTQKPYIATRDYAYRPKMQDADVHLMNRLGQRRFDDMVAARERCAQAERLSRKLGAHRRENVRAFRLKSAAREGGE